MFSIQPFIRSFDIKLIAFDLHGSITIRTSIHPYHIKYRNKYIERNIGSTVPINIQLTTNEAFELFPMLDKYAFYKFRDEDSLFKFEKIHAPCPQLRAKLKILSKTFILALYSDSYRTQIDKTLKAINLQDLFSEIIGIEDNQQKLASARVVYYKLCERHNISINNILKIGDRMDKDINPILQIGGNALRIESNEFVLDALDFVTENLIKK